MTYLIQYFIFYSDKLQQVWKNIDLLPWNELSGTVRYIFFQI